MSAFLPDRLNLRTFFYINRSEFDGYVGILRQTLAGTLAYNLQVCHQAQASKQVQVFRHPSRPYPISCSRDEFSMKNNKLSKKTKRRQRKRNKTKTDKYLVRIVLGVLSDLLVQAPSITSRRDERGQLCQVNAFAQRIEIDLFP